MERKATGSTIGWVLFGLGLLVGAIGVVLISQEMLWGRALVGVGGILIVLSIFAYRRPRGRRGD